MFFFCFRYRKHAQAMAAYHFLKLRIKFQNTPAVFTLYIHEWSLFGVVCMFHFHHIIKKSMLQFFLVRNLPAFLVEVVMVSVDQFG